MSESPRRVLFVCTGNTCRSPLARFLAERLARERSLPWSFSSAGVAAAPGEPLSGGAARVLAARGLDGASHASRALDEALLDEADAVYALSRVHRDEIARRFPARAAKVAVLREAAGLPDPDVPDPVGEDDAVYEACAARIQDALEVLIRRPAHVENHR